MVKNIIKHLIHFFLHIFWIFPVNKRKIYFKSYSGKRYACNPKYLYLWIKENSHVKYSFIWELKEKSDLGNDTKIVKTLYSFRGLYHTLTSKYIVTNRAFSWFIPLKKKQIVLETWHGGGAYKRVGIYENFDKWKLIDQKLNPSQTDFYLSSSAKFTEVQAPSKFMPFNKFINTGLPRNAIFFDKSIMEKNCRKIHDFYSIPYTSKIVLFAPTYRGKTGFKQKQSRSFELDFDRLKNECVKKFGADFVLLYRSHYYDLYLETFLPPFVIDATKYDDMQELLCAADVLVTDYSSSMWDFALTKKPCFLYAPDLQFYANDRGFYTDPKTWPFPLAETEEKLALNIKNFDEAKYKVAVQKHLDDFGSYENKDACEKICKAIGLEV